MTRYTINIGDDFPIEDDAPKTGERRRGPRPGLILRVLFAVSVIAIVVTYPFHTALVTGLALLIRRHPRFQELRSRLRGMRHARHNGHSRHDHRAPPPAGRRDEDRGYGAFV